MKKSEAIAILEKLKIDHYCEPEGLKSCPKGSGADNHNSDVDKILEYLETQPTVLVLTSQGGYPLARCTTSRGGNRLLESVVEVAKSYRLRCEFGSKVIEFLAATCVEVPGSNAETEIYRPIVGDPQIIVTNVVNRVKSTEDV